MKVSYRYEIVGPAAGTGWYHGVYEANTSDGQHPAVGAWALLADHAARTDPGAVQQLRAQQGPGSVTHDGSLFLVQRLT